MKFVIETISVGKTKTMILVFPQDHREAEEWEFRILPSLTKTRARALVKGLQKLYKIPDKRVDADHKANFARHLAAERDAVTGELEITAYWDPERGQKGKLIVVDICPVRFESEHDLITMPPLKKRGAKQLVELLSRAYKVPESRVSCPAFSKD